VALGGSSKAGKNREHLTAGEVVGAAKKRWDIPQNKIRLWDETLVWVRPKCICFFSFWVMGIPFKQKGTTFQVSRAEMSGEGKKCWGWGQHAVVEAAQPVGTGQRVVGWNLARKERYNVLRWTGI